MNNVILNNIFSESKKDKKLIGLRKYNNSGDLWVGYVVDYNDTLVVLQHVSKFGLEDGLVMEKVFNIESFETDTEYIKAYQYLFENPHKIASQTVEKFIAPVSDNWQFDLLYQFGSEKIVGVEINNDDVYYGLIVDFNEEYLHLRSITDVGQDEGTSIYKLTDITALYIDRLENRKRHAFYEWRKKK